MATISELLNWKKEVIVKDSKDNELVRVWIRILGDGDLNESYKQSRIVSSSKRKFLKDETSDDYLDEIVPLEQANDSELKALIKASEQNLFLNEALAKVERGDLPKIEEIAVEPDAPTLEEQEKFDAAIEKVNESYQDSIQNYVNERLLVLEAELDNMPREELVKKAKIEYINVAPMSAFLAELEIQKTFRAVYKDELCKIRMYNTREDYQAEYTFIKDQLNLAYTTLELEPDEVKN